MSDNKTTSAPSEIEGRRAIDRVKDYKDVVAIGATALSLFTTVHLLHDIAQFEDSGKRPAVSMNPATWVSTPFADLWIREIDHNKWIPRGGVPQSAALDQAPPAGMPSATSIDIGK